MREIKFRAWDAKYNQMLYGGERWARYPNWYPVDYVTNMGVVIWNKRRTNDPENTWEFQRLKIHPEISIMQFTGLLDKNGKEIYEGDILGRTTDKNFVFVVDFADGGFSGLTEPGRIHRLSLSNAMTLERSPYIEVIGNIYNNPELIEK